MMAQKHDPKNGCLRLFHSSEIVRKIPLGGGKVLSKLLRALNRLFFSCIIVHGASIPKSVRFYHGGLGVVIGSGVVMGERCIVFQNVTLGNKSEVGEPAYPTIGNDVTLCAGCCVVGDVHIGDGVIVGANAVVTKDIPEGKTVVGANRVLGEDRG